ncbi:MAG: glycosyltransferase family 2 protein [Candidatus Levyibacteriota bacterium]|jgi:GT2 family glycosyltransferase
MDLSIIIVSYNTKEFLNGCLESIYQTTKNINFEVIVVDNASSDGTVKALRKLKNENLNLIENKKNLGFSKANNLGVKKASGRYLLFLNPDIVVHPETLQGMVQFMDQHQDSGAATCKLLLPNGKVDDASHRGFPTPWNSFCHFLGLAKIFGKTKLFGGYNLEYLDLAKTHQIDALAGAFMLVRKKAGEEAGWWDEDYFFYGEDLDFCLMLEQNGWKIYYVPEYSALHYKGVSGGIKRVSKDITTADEQTRIKSQKERFRAMRLFYQKHYEQKYPWLITRLVYSGISLKQKLAA